MLRYIMMFVLVMIMVKTNAQTPFGSTQSSDVMLIKLTTPTQQNINSMQAKVTQDVDFYTHHSGNTGYLVLYREPSSTITQQAAINNYMSEPYVSYASFVYDVGSSDDFVGVANDVFAKAASGITATQVNNVAGQNGALTVTAYHPAEDIYLIEFDKNGNTLTRMQSLIQSGLFDYVEPNYYTNAIKPHHIGDRTTSADCDNVVSGMTDSYMQNRSQWSMFTDNATNWNATYMFPTYATEWSDINVCNAWNLNQGSVKGNPAQVSGSGVYVAVLDDGVDADHYDLNIRMNGAQAYGYDATPRNTPINAHPGAPDQGANHGTGCAGIIAAKNSNTNAPSSKYPGQPTFGMTGVAFDAELMPVRMFEVVLETRIDPITGLPYQVAIYYWTVKATDEAIRWAANNGADILSCSWGGDDPIGGFTVESAIQYATTNGRNGLGCTIVFSTGNENCGYIKWPASNPYTIAVGASNMCHTRTRASNYGGPNGPACPSNSSAWASCDGEDFWGSNVGYGQSSYDVANNRYYLTGDRATIFAPGVKIVTTAPDNNFTPFFNGTSSSTPHVAGTAAMMLAANSCLTYQEIREMLQLSTDRIQPTDPMDLDYQYYYDPLDNFFSFNIGYGKANAGNAVTIAYDMYKQASIVHGTHVFHSSHYIYAGRNLTDVLPMSQQINGNSVTDYIIENSFSTGQADVTFICPTSEAIMLLPGFEVKDYAKFYAEPQNNVCDATQHHYKPGKEEKKEVFVHRGEAYHKLTSDELLFNNVKVYPSPANDFINVELDLYEDAEVNIWMMNILGQKVKDVNHNTLKEGKVLKNISLQGLASGVYIINVETNNNRKQYKFIKE